MSDWTDPNIRNHVLEDSTLTIDKFLETFAFKAKSQSNKTYPYKLKDVYKTYDFLYKALDNEKFLKYSNRLKELSKEYEAFATTSNCKPMKDSYYTYGKKVQVYQFLLIANNLWNMLDYNSDIGSVKVPSKELMNNMLRDMIIGNNYRNMKSLTNPDEIREMIQSSNEAEDEVTLAKIVSDKMYIDQTDVKRRYSSPIISEYLSKVLNELINNVDDSDDDVLEEKINDLFMKLRQYVKETSSEVD